jgi:hypothetical protein
LLFFRPILFIGEVVFLVYAAVVVLVYPLSAVISTGMAVFLFAMVFSDQVALWMARPGAFLATIGRG